MIVQIVAPGIASITTKKALGADKIGVFNLCFWINVFGTAAAFFYYGMHYHVNPKPPFFSYTYQLGLLDCAGIFVFVVVVDCFNLACLTYIAKTGQVSKAAVYSTLNATWTIVFGIIQSKYELWIIFYLIAIYTGYTFINYDKKVAADKAKRAKVRIRFLKKVDESYEILKRKSIDIGSDVDDDELLEKIGMYSPFSWVILSHSFVLLDRAVHNKDPDKTSKIEYKPEKQVPLQFDEGELSIEITGSRKTQNSSE